MKANHKRLHVLHHAVDSPTTIAAKHRSTKSGLHWTLGLFYCQNPAGFVFKNLVQKCIIIWLSYEDIHLAMRKCEL
jgi:hypothetical protein